MKTVFLIAKKELKAYFISPIAYVVLAFFLLVAGYFFSVVLFVTGEASFTIAASNMVVTFLFLVPLVTMKLFPEERKSGTLEMLLTQPVRDIEIVLGKFLAAFALIGTMIAATLTHVIILYRIGTPDGGPIISFYIGVLLLAAAFVSLGMFASTLTKNQIIAAMLAFVFLLILWIFSGISNYLGGNQDVITYIAMSSHFDDFLKGVVDLRDVVYFLSFTAFWLFMSILSLGVRRWK